MKMPRVLLLFFTLLSSLFTLSQGIISGTVSDAETKQPLEGASVFAQNTTMGVVTKNDGSFKLQLNKGGYELIVSFTGYTSERINVEANGDKTLNIELKKEDKSLSEVVVRSSNEVLDGWEKYGDFFLDHFIGSSPVALMAKLENPEALKFYYFKRTDKLKVLATEPLRITHNALGYQMQYALDSFVYYYKSHINSYRGNCFYLNMDGDSAQQLKWSNARLNAYLGSRLHFIRSYYDSSLKQEGFTVDLLSIKDKNKFNRLTNPYDTAYFAFQDSSADVELWFPVKASISYLKQKPEKEYLEEMALPKDVPVQISYVDLAQPILIKENGYFIDQRSWVNQGYWSWKNIGDQLPYDYIPQ
jgi:hypothetical protein